MSHVARISKQAASEKEATEQIEGDSDYEGVINRQDRHTRTVIN